MKLKNSISYILLIIVFFTACESQEKKVDDAFEQLKESKLNGTDTANTLVVIPDKETKIKVVVKNELVDEWLIFKKETDLKIDNNDTQIKLLKSKKNKSENKNKFDKQTTALEQKNNDLRKQMNDYHEEMKLKWEKFKLGINHDIDEIGIELKDITINNTQVKK